jgi:hypothetical protein
MGNQYLLTPLFNWSLQTPPHHQIDKVSYGGKKKSLFVMLQSKIEL